MNPLFHMASQKLDEAVASEEGLLNAILACAVLGEWLIGRGRRLEGHSMISRGVG